MRGAEGVVDVAVPQGGQRFGEARLAFRLLLSGVYAELQLGKS